MGYLTFDIGYWNFGNNRSINWLFSEVHNTARSIFFIYNQKCTVNY